MGEEEGKGCYFKIDLLFNLYVDSGGHEKQVEKGSMGNDHNLRVTTLKVVAMPSMP
jgi:hypothetical protein